MMQDLRAAAAAAAKKGVIQTLEKSPSWYKRCLHNFRFAMRAKTIENVVKYVWSMQSVNPAVQNVGPVGRC